MRPCQECKANVDATIRQQMACGYEPATADAVPWCPPSMIDRGVTLTVCPGFTTSLPAVGEVVQAFPQWENRTLTDYLGGEPPTEIALDLLTVFRAGIREHEADVMRAKSKGRG